jgi:hypothetical protein
VNKKYSRLDSQLIQIIREIIKEELDRHFSKKRDFEPEAQTTSTRSSTSETDPGPDNISPPRLVDDFGDGPWAIFGTPEPDPKKHPRKAERPRALPGWQEPYRPNFTGFDSPPPYLNRNPEEAGN